ncbi:MAG: hypothetical protein Q4D14_02945 [Bacteroidales bacterium]|nr:hypothetical protein [Bacteroidales bacterium]
MGARGAFDRNLGRTGGITFENRYYSCVGTLNNIKIIQCDAFKNNPTPTYSNTYRTTYYAYSKENRRIEHIYYYQNHKLFKSVDFKKGEEPHTHYWGGGQVGRKRHDTSNTKPLSDRDKRLMQLAQLWNQSVENHGKESY